MEGVRLNGKEPPFGLVLQGQRNFKKNEFTQLKPIESNCFIGLKEGAVVLFGAEQADPELILFDENVTVLDCGISADLLLYFVTQRKIFLYDRESEKKRSLVLDMITPKVTNTLLQFLQIVVDDEYAFSILGERGFACLIS